ncbi:MAG TPA: serine hydrolase domain-containing protein [Amycolatopsis sp.]|jgi:D-alanyl-D-alanine carboxypeptidase
MGSRGVFAGVAVLLTTVLGAGAAGADSPSPGEVLQAGVGKLQATDSVVGAIGLVRGGAGPQYAAAGYGDYFGKVPADPHAKFRIGSNTKAFVSTVLLQLEAEHKLSLDDTVDRWLPGVVNKNGNDGTKISVRELLDHTSGIPDFINGGQPELDYVANLDPNRPWTAQQLVDLALQGKPTSAPGASWHYSNTNYVLAGLVIKAVTGNEPSAEVRSRIIEPLGLHDTTFPTTDPAMPANHLNGYFHLERPLFLVRDVTVSDIQFGGTAGAMISTVDDLLDFERALFSGKLLPPAQQQELETTVPRPGGADGLGVTRYQSPCGPLWTHDGADLGYLSMWATSPDGQRQAVVAVNEYNLLSSDRGNAIVGDLKTGVVDAFCATR